MQELIVAIVIVLLLGLLARMWEEQKPDDILVVAANPVPPQQPYIKSSPGSVHGSGCGNVLDESGPYQAFDGCMASCGECNAYNTEPVLREMVFFNNLFDKEHSYECDPPGPLPFARVFAD